MPAQNEVIGSASVEVRATVSKLRADMRESERVVQRSMGAISRQTRNSQNAVGGFSSAFKRELQSSSASVAALNTQLGRTENIITAIGGAFVAQQIVRLADEYTNLGARIRLVTREGESFNEIQNELFTIAQRLRAPLNEMVGLYVRIRQATGAADAEARRMVETFAQTLAISGANAAESASFMTQIGQALGEGYLRAEELNTVLSTNPRFVRLLADYLGVATTEIRKLSREGRITTDVLRGAAVDGAGQLAEEMAGIPLTVGGAIQQLQNAMLRYVGETDQGLGASRRLAEGLSILARNFQDVADAILLVGAVAGAGYAGRAISRGITIAGRELVALDSAFRERKAELERDQDRLFDRSAQYDAASAPREKNIARLRRLQDLARARIERINQRRAARMFGSDGMAIDRALQTGQPPVLRDPNSVAGPMRVGQGRNEAQELERAQRKLAQAERELQRIRAEGHGAAVRNLQTQNRLVWVTRELAGMNGVLAQSQRLVQAGAIGMGRIFGSLWNFLGGPWGVALAAATTAWAVFRGEQDKAAMGLARMESALALIASAAPPATQATEQTAEAADRLGDAADNARDLATAENLASRAARSLAENQEQAARATDLRARAQRGLAAAQERSARATLQEALAESRRLQRSLPGQIRNLESGVPALQNRIETIQNYPVDVTGARNQSFATATAALQERLQQIEDARALLEMAQRDEPLFRDAMDALNEGFDFASGTAPAGGNPDGGTGSGTTLESLRMQAQLSLARLRNDQQRVAVLEDALEVEQRTKAYVEAGLAADRARAQALAEVRIEREAIQEEQRRSLELTEMQFRADLERSRGNVLTAEALEDEIALRQMIRDLTLDGLSQEEAARTASARQQEQQAARAAERERELALMRLEMAREIAEAEGNQTRADQIGRQIEAVRRGRELLESGAVDSEGRGQKEAAREAGERARAIVRGQVRGAFEEAMFEAVTGGDWKEALAESLHDAAREGFSRAMDYLFDMIAIAFRQLSAANSGGGGGFLGDVVKVGASVFGFGGGKSVGGKVNGDKWYMVGENGPEPFFPGVDGSIGTNRAMRNALGAANSGQQKVELQVKAQTDGSVYLEIAAAEQRATVQGARMGAQIITKSLKQGSTV